MYISASHVHCINWFNILRTRLDYIHFWGKLADHTFKLIKHVAMGKAILNVHFEIISFTYSEIVVN